MLLWIHIISTCLYILFSVLPFIIVAISMGATQLNGYGNENL